MTDIVERLRTFLGNGIGEDAAKEIESLRQQLEELKVNHKAELVMRDQNSQMCLDNTRKLLAESQAKFVECQAREKVRAEALAKVQRAICLAADLDPLGVIGRLYNEISPAAELPSDSTALDSAIKQAKREALLEAADYANTIDSPLSHASLCRMAVEMP